MALSDKNILITPNIGQSADPRITFSGADASTGPQNINVLVYPTNSGTLSVEGTAGQLFSITNSMTGTIYSVNDISGVPSIEVLDTGQIKLAEYSGYVSILGTTNASSSTTGVLRVSGGAGIAQDLYVGGTLYRNGISVGYGYTGSAGTNGYTGSAGAGYTGSQGIIGYTGSQGIQGVIGYTGSQGTQGTTGYTGSVGSQGVIGYTGSQGSQGIIGYTGSVGSQGVIGYTGSQGDIGYTGSQGIQGVIGYTGSQGTQGNLGYTGSQGTQGNLGYTGSQGSLGYTGSTGYTGSVGVGYTGSQGIIGYTGSSGTGGGSITVSDTAPSTPLAGALWWDSISGTLKIYYDDGTSSQWVDATPMVAGPQGVIGYTGSTGSQGTTGYTGSAGGGGGITTGKAIAMAIVFGG